MGRKKSYTPAPEVSSEMDERLVVVMEVLAGIKTMSEGAKALNLSRNHFQTLVHRGVGAMIEAISPKPAGRPAKPESVAALEVELEKLRRENAQLHSRVGTTDRLLEVASGLLHGRIRARPPRSKTTPEKPGEGDGDPEPELRRTLQAIDEMRVLGLSTPLACAVAGVHPATARRWRARRRMGKPLLLSSSAAVRAVPLAAAAKVEHLVRRLNGQSGAESLRHSVVGISRRQAARIKADTLRAMERERKVAAIRITVTAPDVIRGMDGVHFHGADGPLWALFSADGAVPYRTSVTTGRRYDAGLVEHALLTDIEQNGAPIVYRFDRAKAHDTPKVRQLLETHQVLVLHGPPHCPRYYGQHERQNREHRAWADQLARLPADEVESCLLDMLASVNGLWRRRKLGWKTASEVWKQRLPLNIDRHELRQEVQQRASRIARDLDVRGKPADLAERLAIEQALERRGYLRKEVGGWC
jgi:hypothetical protein